MSNAIRKTLDILNEAEQLDMFGKFDQHEIYKQFHNMVVKIERGAKPLVAAQEKGLGKYHLKQVHRGSQDGLEQTDGLRSAYVVSDPTKSQYSLPNEMPTELHKYLVTAFSNLLSELDSKFDTITIKKPHKQVGGKNMIAGVWIEHNGKPTKFARIVFRYDTFSAIHWDETGKTLYKGSLDDYGPESVYAAHLEFEIKSGGVWQNAMNLPFLNTQYLDSMDFYKKRK